MRTNPVSRHSAIAAAICLFSAIITGPRAEATWSIIIVDTRTGEIAVGSATCLTNFDLQAGTPVLLTGIGAATAQSFVDSSHQNRTFIRNGLLDGVDPEQIIADLAGFDTGHQTRQYGIVDAAGRAATFSGTSANAWAGGVTGQIGDLVYAVQGNILTGEPVVTAAVDAIIDTPGDLAEKLMAAMEAARLMGGDGRCSCPGNPTGCGSPPPQFDKSAHIAYMLIARAGDTDGCNGAYRAGSQPMALTAIDVDGDGMPDIAASVRFSPDLAVARNTTEPGAAFARFDLPTSAPAGGQGQAVIAADIDGDGFADLIATTTNPDTVAVLRNLGDGTFAAPVNHPVGQGAQRTVAADLTGNGHTDLAAISSTAGVVTLLVNDGAGSFTQSAVIDLDAQPISIAARDFTGNGAADLFVALADEQTVAVLLNDGAGNFTPSDPIELGARPSWIIAEDLTGNGETDLAVVLELDNTLSVFTNQNGQLTRTDYPVEGRPHLVVAGDLTGDGSPELVVTRLITNEFVVLRAEGGGFVLDGEYLLSGRASDLVLADFTGDGSLDVAAVSRVIRSVMLVENRGDGTFNSGVGCATGDYFMQFNVAFQSVNDPDPVFTLQDMFDDWRDGLVGRPDAVRTDAAFDPGRIPGDGESTAELFVIPMDWRGDPATAPIADVSVSHAPDSAGISSIGAPTINPDGTVAVEITAGVGRGFDRFTVTIDDGVRPVTLMPAPELGLTGTADWNGDGVVDFDDVLDFLADFDAGDADFNLDGVTDSDDLFLFLAAWADAA